MISRGVCPRPWAFGVGLGDLAVLQPESATVWSARLSWRSLKRLRRNRLVVWPLLAGIGAIWPAWQRQPLADLARVRPGTEKGGGDDGANSGLVEQVGSPGANDGQDGLLVASGLGA